MMRFAKVTPVCCLVAASALALAQPPAPPQPPAPAPAPAPVATPAPPARPKVYLEGLGDLKIDIDADAIQQKVDAALSRIDFDQINEQAARAAELSLSLNADELAQQAQEMMRRAQEKYGDMQLMYSQDKYGDMMAFAQQAPVAPKAPMAPMPPQPGTLRQLVGPFGQDSLKRIGRLSSVDALYDRGQRALDNHTFDQALDDFTEVANRGGARADAALYWKAYTLNKLGRRDEATAALAELRTKYASSRWLDDAKALEIEVKQSAGQKVTPESQSDDELKLLALNGLAQSDPDRAIPTLERLLKGAQAPRVKKEAIYVLAANSSPKAQQLLEQIARGSANPDLQLQAILYIGRTGKQTNRGQLLAEIYGSATDPAVKRAVLNALVSSKDKEHLIQLAKNEKNADLRLDAIRMVGSTADQAEMWQFYQSETDPAVKAELLRLLSGNTEKLIEVARTEKDAKLRRAAVQSLGSVKAANTSDALVSIYGSEQDQQVKRSIINSLASQRNVQALMQLGRKESDPELKKSIVRAIVDMHSPEATQFLEEILK
jgi:hypothetical protein